MKKIVLLLVLLCAASVLFAQISVGEPDATNLGSDTAQQMLVEVPVTKFEDSGLWYATMSRDQGNVTLQRIESLGSVDKLPIPEEEEMGLVESDRYVLGLKIQFYKRGINTFSLYPVRPLPVEGVTKTLSVWVIGRNTKHVLKILISDQFGHKAELTLGKLNFSGWKKLTVAIPTTIIQRDYHYSNRMGIKIEGFKVVCDPLESYGSYYIYFDDLRATTDLFAEVSRDEDDLQDNW